MWSGSQSQLHPPCHTVDLLKTSTNVPFRPLGQGRTQEEGPDPPRKIF